MGGSCSPASAVSCAGCWLGGSAGALLAVDLGTAMDALCTWPRALAAAAAWELGGIGTARCASPLTRGWLRADVAAVFAGVADRATLGLVADVGALAAIRNRSQLPSLPPAPTYCALANSAICGPCGVPRKRLTDRAKYQ